MDQGSPARTPIARPPIVSGMQPEGRVLAVTAIAISVAISTLDSTIANTALPTIAADLGTDAATSIWVITAYQLVMVMTLLPLSSLGEIVGYRRIYLGGLIVFTLASFACAIATSLPTLVAARSLQGLGAAGIVSVNTAMIRFIYPSRLLGRGVGFMAFVVAVSSALGPTLASAILSVASWIWLFAINVPFGLLAIALGFRNLPDTPGIARRFDWPDALLSAVTFCLFILAVGEGAHAAAPGLIAAELAGACLLAIVLVRRQATQEAPLLPLDLFRRPIFALSSVTSICSFTCQGLAFVALPFYFQTMLGRSQTETGLLMTPWPVAVAFMAPLAGRLADRYAAGILGSGGLVVLATGMLLLAILPSTPSTLDIVWRMGICGAGFGFFQAPNLRTILASAPPNRSGGASGIIAISRLLGQTLGAALVALCLGLFPTRGTLLALGLGAAFAAAAAIVSLMRLVVPTKS